MAFRGLALAAVILLTSAVAARAEFFVTGSGFSSLDDGVTQTPFDITEGIASDGAKVISGLGFSSVGPGGPQQSLLQAGGSGFAFAAQGRLGASINTAADFINVTPGTTFAPRVEATFSGRFTDNLEAKSDTLPFGAPVSMLITLALKGTSNNPSLSPGFLGQPTGTVFLNVTSPDFFIPFIFLPPAFAPQSGVPSSLDIAPTYAISTTVGAIIPIQAVLSLSSLNRAGQGQGVTQQTILDYSHTFNLYVDPVTPGLNITSESGHNYATGAPTDPATPVPEPSTLVLSMLFFATVIPMALRRRRASGSL